METSTAGSLSEKGDFLPSGSDQSGDKLGLWSEDVHCALDHMGATVHMGHIERIREKYTCRV